MNLYPLDFETYSELNLSKVGAYKYAQTAEVILMQIAKNKSPVHVFEIKNRTIPEFLQEAIADKKGKILAHNAVFERLVIRFYFGIDLPASKFYCSMVKAYSHGLPGKLSTLGTVLELPKHLLKLDGEKLIKMFCSPRPKGREIKRLTREHKPVEWEAFKEYAKQDVRACLACWNKIPDINYPGADYADWLIDQEYNDYGIGFDVELANSAIEAVKTVSEKMNLKLAEYTGGAVKTIGQRDVLKKWIQDKGLYLPDLRRETLESVLADE